MPQGDEAAFRAWYTRWAQRLNLSTDPDDPRHFYDYRAAFRAGATPDSQGHWPSRFKLEGHPNLVIGGVNTRTGETMPKNDPAGYLPNVQQARKKKPGEQQREAELEFAKDTESPRAVRRAEENLRRLRAALAEKRGERRKREK